MTRTTLVLTAALCLLACRPTPRPRVLEAVDETRASAAAQRARELAPQDFLRAEALRQQAARAQEEGDTAGAQILGERAIAAYSHAFVVARLVTAERRVTAARKLLADNEAELAKIDAEQRKTAGDADALERRAKVLRDALPLAGSKPSTPEREAARLDAARALVLDARLACASAALIKPDLPGLTEQGSRLDALDAALAKKPAATPIDDALAARSRCLELLTGARRTTSGGPADGAADALLAELSGKAELEPSRDDRGVVVQLRGVFARGDVLTADARQRLAALASVAKAHPTFPLLVVVHTARGPASSKRAQAVTEALTAGGAPGVAQRLAGDARPVVPPKQKGAATRNERVEIVFVSPR